MEMIPSARSEFALLIKYFDGVHMNKLRKDQRILSDRKPQQKQPASKYNLELKVDGETVALPFTNAPIITQAETSGRELESSPLKNDALQRLSARSRAREKRVAIKRVKSQMAESRRKIQIEKAQQSAIKLNRLNE
jgi:hypothetical protein